MKVVIVDDSPVDREKAYQYVSQYYNDITALDPTEIKERFYIDYDIYFLDIEMFPNGKDIAKKINSIHSQAIFIFMTNHDSYIFETQILNPFYFIRKSHFEDDLKIALEILKNMTDDYLSILFNQEEILIKFNDIKYIEIYRGKMTFHTREKDIYSWGTLNNLQKQLPQERFIRIHNSYIINKDYIESIKKNEVTIDNCPFPISRKYQKKFHNFIKRGML